MHTNRALEQARLAKRATRHIINPTQTGIFKGVITPSDIALKRLTRKEKAAKTKISEIQQRMLANETAKMAIESSLTSSKFKKSYSWLDDTASLAASAGQKANVGNKRGHTSDASLSSISYAYDSARIRPSTKRGKRQGEWDENDDDAIQARDVLLMLENDRQAVKALSRAYNTLEKAVKR